MESRYEVMEQLEATQKGHEILRSHSAVHDHWHHPPAWANYVVGEIYRMQAWSLPAALIAVTPVISASGREEAGRPWPPASWRK